MLLGSRCRDLDGGCDAKHGEGDGGGFGLAAWLNGGKRGQINIV